MKIDGQCYCGEITFEAEVDPEKIGICHCADCQALSASAFRTIAPAPGESFKILTGEPKEYVKVADSGNRRIQAFCPTCGSGLYAADASDTPAVYNLRVGVIRQRDELKPTFEVWRHSQLSWLPDLGTEKQFDKGPESY